MLLIKDGDQAAAVDRVGQAAAGIDHVDTRPRRPPRPPTGDYRDGVIVFPLAVTGTRDDVLKAAARLREELKVGEVTDGVQPYVVGQQALWAGMQQLQQEDLEKAETTGFPLILIVLLAVFGSVLAALLPVGLGVAAVIITGAVVFFISLAITMSVFVTNVASMLGIGVAVDYSLFVLSRYREDLREGARPREEALNVAMRTSGATVVFSGITVIVSLAGLFLINSTVMRSLAIGAIVVVGDRDHRRHHPAARADRAARRSRQQGGKIVSVTGSLYRRVGPQEGASLRARPRSGCAGRARS